MHHWLETNNRDMTDCGKTSPVQLLHRQKALGPHLLAIHVNYLAPGDARLLARTRTNVVHCPRSHDFFSHAPFPFAKLRRAGVNICLGTDSLATIRVKPRQTITLNMFDEMRVFAANNPEVPPETILQMATHNGAKAIGRARQLGVLRPGTNADIIAVPCSSPIQETAAAIIHNTAPLRASLISGDWAMSAD